MNSILFVELETSKTFSPFRCVLFSRSHKNRNNPETFPAVLSCSGNAPKEDKNAVHEKEAELGLEWTCLSISVSLTHTHTHIHIQSAKESYTINGSRIAHSMLFQKLFTEKCIQAWLMTITRSAWRQNKSLLAVPLCLTNMCWRLLHHYRSLVLSMKLAKLFNPDVEQMLCNGNVLLEIKAIRINLSEITPANKQSVFFSFDVGGMTISSLFSRKNQREMPTSHWCETRTTNDILGLKK